MWPVTRGSSTPVAKKKHARRAQATPKTYDPNKPPGYSYPGQTPANDPWIDALVQAGVEFWGRRGVTVPPDVARDAATNLDSAVGRGWGSQQGSDRRFAVLTDYADQALKDARNHVYLTRERRESLRPLMETIFHELGHVGGLPHSMGGLMDGNGVKSTPHEGMRLIRRLIPRDDLTLDTGGPKRKRIRKRDKTTEGAGYG